MNRKKVIHIHDYKTETGYFLNEDDDFILHSFDDEPAIIWSDGTKYWFKDGLKHRDNNLPAIIYSDGDCGYYKNENRYWFINGEEYYDIDDVYEKFKNKILKFKNTNINLLKDNDIVESIYIYIQWNTLY